MAGVRAGVVAGVLVAGSVVAAAQQPQQAAPAQRAQQIQSRFQIAAMEGVLERAVQLGAQQVRLEVQQVAPDLLFTTGAARARGFWLDGYGVFFDVDVPAIRRSLAWSFRMLDRSDRGGAVLAAMKRQVAAIEDPEAKRELLQSIQQLEREVNPGIVPARAGDAAGTPQVVVPPGPGAPPAPRALTPAQAAVLENPGLAYTNAVKKALIDAMVEYGASIPLSTTDSLAVAARDQEGTRLQPGDPYDVATVILRLRGVDLAAYRAGEIDGDEIRRRVETKDY